MDYVWQHDGYDWDRIQQQRRRTVAIKKDFKPKGYVASPEAMRAIDEIIAKDKAAQEEGDTLACRFQWLRIKHNKGADRGSGPLEQVNKTVAADSLYGYGGFLVSVFHPKHDEIMKKMWTVFRPYVPATKKTIGAPMYPKR